MYRYQILIEYVGTPFVGWQIQKKGKSVQKIKQKLNSNPDEIIIIKIKEIIIFCICQPMKGVPTYSIKI